MSINKNSKTMTKEEFLQFYTECYGERIDSLDQIYQPFRGEDLLELVNDAINHIHLKDGVDVYKALSDFVMEKNRTLPMHDADWIEFAQYFAKRCGVGFGEYKYPIYEKGMMVKWQGSDFWVVEDKGDYNVLIANTPNFNDRKYNDWWVDKAYINKKH